MMMRPAVIILMLSAFVCLTPIPALCDTMTYTCHYQSYSDRKGNHKMAEDFFFDDAAATEKQKAKTIGSKGRFDVEMLYSPSGGMTFIEMIDGGKVLTTTIDSSGKSVHSRNIIVEGEILPSQYYGTCSKR
ncbi:MAG: hypothetical protein EHM37_03695 [Deltaproteobacteria bacterium]|nr:MAG: hypothetical protein EHM37_03695 [Deltaproteobacteria bacterium]